MMRLTGSRRHRPALWPFSLVFLLGLPSPPAQSGDLIDFFPNLSQPISLALSGTLTDQTNSVEFDAIVAGTYNPADALGNLTTSAFGQLQQFPVGGSFSAFTFSFDPQLAVPVRTTAGLGPVFGERAQTTGKGKFNTAFSYSYVRFEEFEGTNLDDLDVDLRGTRPGEFADGSGSAGQGSVFFSNFRARQIGPGERINFSTPGSGFCPCTDRGVVVVDSGDDGQGDIDYAVEFDFPSSKLDASIEAQLISFFLNYGVTDRIDVGLVLPLVHLQLEGEVTTTGLLDPASQIGNLIPMADSVFEDDETYTGIGDIVARAKWWFFDSEWLDAALRADVALPTGDEDNLAGRGDAAITTTLIASKNFKWVSPHATAGLLVPFDSEAGTFLWTAGADVRLHDRITLPVDVVGANDLEKDGIGDNRYSVAAGLKFNPPIGNLTLSVTALIALNDEGLRAPVVPSASAEYTF